MGSCPFAALFIFDSIPEFSSKFSGENSGMLSIILCNTGIKREKTRKKYNICEKNLLFAGNWYLIRAPPIFRWFLSQSNEIRRRNGVCRIMIDSSLRTVYILESLFADFQYYHDVQVAIMEENPGYSRDGYVFCQESGDPYEPRTYQDLFKRCVRQAGIAEANFHSLRHTFATRALKQGMDVVTLAQLLGHANPSITLDKYGHALDDHKRESVERLDALYAEASPAAPLCRRETEIPRRMEFSLNMKR